MVLADGLTEDDGLVEPWVVALGETLGEIDELIEGDTEELEEVEELGEVEAL